MHQYTWYTSVADLEVQCEVAPSTRMRRREQLVRHLNAAVLTRRTQPVGQRSDVGRATYVVDRAVGRQTPAVARSTVDGPRYQNHLVGVALRLERVELTELARLSVGRCDGVRIRGRAGAADSSRGSRQTDNDDGDCVHKQNKTTRA